MSELYELGVKAAMDGLARGEFSSEDIVRSLIGRYHEKNGGFDYADFTVICEDIVTDAVPKEKKKKKK